MPSDLDAFAETVVLTIKTALLPVLERLATIEQAQKDLQGRTKDIGDLRDRVVVVETKAALVPHVAPVVESPAPVDLTPVLERLAAAEARLLTVGDLRDRVVTVETKAAAVVPAVSVDLLPVLERLSVLEARSSVPGPAGADGRDGQPGKDGTPGPQGPPGERSEGPVGRDGRDGLPGMGIVGDKGADGRPGLDGKDGRDGTLEQLKVLFDGERTATLCRKDGTPIEGGVITFPVEIYRGVYVEGKTYVRGDGVTWAGSEWGANDTTTTKPGDGSKAWTLKVKRGRDGKDGRDAPGALPVVSVGRPA